MEFRQLEYFIEVVQRKSVTAAAVHLHVAQPSLSQALLRLERELGSRLFDRVGRGMRLTAAGAALLPSARHMLAEREYARAAVADVRGLRGGRVTLVSLPSLTVDPLASVVAEFRRRYPLVTIHITESLQEDEISAGVESGEYDIGLAPRNRTGSRLVGDEIQTQPLALVTNNSYSSLTSPATPQDLATLPFVTGPPGGSSRRALEELMREHGQPLQIAVETESTEAILPLVQAGAGVALLPRGLVFPGAPRVRVLATDPPLERRTYVLSRPGHSSPAVRAFVDTAVAWSSTARS